MADVKEKVPQSIGDIVMESLGEHTDWEEVVRLPVTFGISTFWRQMEDFVRQPQYVCKRIAYITVLEDGLTSLKNAKGGDWYKSGGAARVTRRFFPRTPQLDSVIEDEATFYFADSSIEFVPNFFPSNIAVFVSQPSSSVSSSSSSSSPLSAPVVPSSFSSSSSSSSSASPSSSSSSSSSGSSSSSSSSDTFDAMEETSRRAPTSAFIPSLPFYYAQVERFSYKYVPCTSSSSSSSSSSPDDSSLSPKAEVVVSARFFKKNAEHYKTVMVGFTSHNLRLLEKRGKRDEEIPGGYQKRVHLDQVVPRSMFYDVYMPMKEKYKVWCDLWTESTDPAKFVWEELSIAAFLICLWRIENERLGTTKPQSFVDVGCGNGFLTFILTNEGYPGKGIDIAARKIWSEYEKHGVKPNLLQQPLKPEEASFPDIDWIVGNHADELTPWIPLMASRAPNCRYFLLPCCLFDFTGRWQGSVDKKIGRYHSYLKFTENIGIQCGFTVETENLRIPSTKNIAQIGRERNYNVSKSDDLQRVEAQRKQLLANFVPGSFEVRATDKEKHVQRAQKMKEKKERRQGKKQKQYQEYLARKAKEAMEKVGEEGGKENGGKEEKEQREEEDDDDEKEEEEPETKKQKTGR